MPADVNVGIFCFVAVGAFVRLAYAYVRIGPRFVRLLYAFVQIGSRFVRLALLLCGYATFCAFKTFQRMY